MSHLCGWTCVSSCLTSGGTSSRSTGTGRAACPSGWAGAWTAWRSAWSFCRRFCSWSSSPVRYVKCQRGRPRNSRLKCRNTAGLKISDSIAETRFQFRGLPASAPLCADPGSLRVRRFSRRSRTQTAASRCAIAAHGPPAREVWRTPLGK